MEVHERLERLRRRAALEQWLLSTQPEGIALDPQPDAAAPEDAAPAAGGDREDAVAEDAVAEDVDTGTRHDPVAVSDEVVGGPVVPPGGTTPQPPGSGLVEEVVVALRQVLRRHPGATVGIWAPGRGPGDPDAAVLVSFDERDGLSVRPPGRAWTGGSAVAAELAHWLRDGDSDA